MSKYVVTFSSPNYLSAEVEADVIQTDAGIYELYRLSSRGNELVFTAPFPAINSIIMVQEDVPAS